MYYYRLQIRSVGSNRIEVTGSDATGAMYGGLEVADLLRLGLLVEDQKRAPFVKKPGIKFNVPLDVRTPSYDDTGNSAQNNIETVWDFEFWKTYLDDLARHHYNVLSLWSAHPYPSIIKLKEYPDVALGITASRRLVVFCEDDEGRKEIVWMSPVQN